MLRDVKGMLRDVKGCQGMFRLGPLALHPQSTGSLWGESYRLHPEASGATVGRCVQEPSMALIEGFEQA